MNAEKIKHYLSNPLLIMVHPDREILEECLKEYPFFQSVRILYLIAHNQQEGIFSGSLLSKTAVYAGERSNLYHLLSQKLTATYSVEDLKNQDQEQKSARKKTDSRELIDKFIESSPIITRPKAEFYHAADKAAKSIMEDEEFVSETLASIYVSLQKYEKAISIYQKLSLIFPEKSNYFALLINNLENKINE